MPQSNRQDLKHRLIEIGTQVFFSTENESEWGNKFTSGADFKAALIDHINQDLKIQQEDLDALFELANKLQVMPDEERYGTLKFMLSGSPKQTSEERQDPKDTIDSIIRFKRTNAVDTPHTEDLISRIQGQVAAARKLVAESKLAPQEKIEHYHNLDSYLQRAQQDIAEHCYLDPKKIPTHRQNSDNTSKHKFLHDQQAKSAYIMKKLSDRLAEQLQDVVFIKSERTLTQKIKRAVGFTLEERQVEKKLSRKKKVIKNQIYLQETALMSKKRPELVVVRPILSKHPDHPDKPNYIAISIVPPIDPERTISSGKKDEQGLANFVAAENWIADEKGKILDKRKPSLRSASLVPQDIFFDGKDETLIREVTRMNVRHHLLPALVEMAKAQQGQAGKSPIKINYTLQTLLSPLGSIGGVRDKLMSANPDYLQVTAIRDALNEIANRPITLDDGTQVQLDVNYLNHGCNVARGGAGYEKTAIVKGLLYAEESLNAKGFNQILEKNIVSIQEKTLKENLTGDNNLIKINKIFDNAPKFSRDDQEKFNTFNEKLREIYRWLDDHDMSKQDHARLTELIVKNKRHISNKYQTPKLTHEEKEELNALQAKRSEINEARAPIEQQARALEEKKEEMHTGLNQNHMRYFKSQANELSQSIENLENSSDERAKKLANHCRTLEQYIQLIQIGYDERSHIFKGEKKHVIDENKRNYQPQSFLHLLCDNTNDIHHKTCKSGKDRTNSAEEMEQALHQASIILSKVPQLAQDKKWDDDKDRQFFIELFNAGYVHGNGNYICGLNMPPGAQQVSSKDIPSMLDVDIWKKTLASFQKGAYKKVGEMPESLKDSLLVTEKNPPPSNMYQNIRQLSILSVEIDEAIHLTKKLETKITSYMDDPKRKNYKVEYKKDIKKWQEERHALEKYKDHVQRMQDISIKIALLDHQINHPPAGMESHQVKQLIKIQKQLNDSLQKGYQDLLAMNEDPELPASFIASETFQLQFRIFKALSESDLFKKTPAGMKIHGMTDIRQLLKTTSNAPPKIIPLINLSAKGEKHYTAEYEQESKVAPLRIVEKHQTEYRSITVTAEVSALHVISQAATFEKIVDIAKKIKAETGQNEVAIIAPDAKQATLLAAALIKAGFEPNLDGHDNGFSPEVKQSIIKDAKKAADETPISGILVQHEQAKKNVREASQSKHAAPQESPAPEKHAPPTRRGTL